MPLEWMLLTQWAGGARTASALLDAACTKDLVRIMDSIGGVHLNTASRLLTEAGEREAEARRVKCVNAVGHLEIAYTAFTTIPAGVRGLVARYLTPNRYWRAERDAAVVAVMLAGAYAALGDDAESVETRLNQGIVHLWHRHLSIWTNECSGRPMPFDVAVSLRLADERSIYVDTATAIADHMELTGAPREPASWPHERDPRLRVPPEASPG